MFTDVQVDHRSPVPAYRQIYLVIKKAIGAGVLTHGEKLPPTRELAGLLGLNRATVTAAYELLELDGLIAGHVGRGSFVEATSQAAPDGIRWDELVPPNAWETMGPPAAGGEVISFASSRPAEAQFPLEDFRAVCAEVTGGEDIGRILQLGGPGGYAPLLGHLREQAAADQAARPGDDILITNGCQQALDLLVRVLIRPGDGVILEDPVYPGLIQLFRRAGARLIGVPVDGEGIDAARACQSMAREQPKMLVLAPTFQNPTGATMPRAARASVLGAARERGVIVIENDIYSGLRYQAHPVPALKQLDEGGDVVLLRSFSKVAFPGLRVGWVIAPRALIAALTAAKQWCDLHTNQLSQAVLLRFAESGRLERHVERARNQGRVRLRAVLDACGEFLPPGAGFTRPEGGMNLWVRLPDPLDAGELAARARQEGVAYLAGRYFSVSRPHTACLRLSFAALEPEKIRRGLQILGGIFAGELERAARGPEPVPAMV